MWSTFDEFNNVKNYKNEDKSNINLNTMQEIEKATNYEFSFFEKSKKLLNEISEEAKEDINRIQNVFNFGSEMIKFLLILFTVSFIFFISSKVKKALKWMY